MGRQKFLSFLNQKKFITISRKTIKTTKSAGKKNSRKKLEDNVEAIKTIPFSLQT